MLVTESNVQVGRKRRNRNRIGEIQVDVVVGLNVLARRERCRCIGSEACVDRIVNEERGFVFAKAVADIVGQAVAKRELTAQTRNQRPVFQLAAESRCEATREKLGKREAVGIIV